MDTYQDPLQSLNLQQTLTIRDEATNVPNSSSPTITDSDALFQLQQSLYAAFQHTASCITQLYKPRLDTTSELPGGDRWQAFQQAAAAATVLYREACDVVRKAQEIVKLSESIALTKPQVGMANASQPGKRTRRGTSSSKRHNAVVSGSMAFGGTAAAGSDESDDDSSPMVIRSGSGAVLEVGIGTNAANLGTSSSGSARKRTHVDEPLAAETSGTCAGPPTPRIGNALPLPADFERASVEYFREQKRARF